MGFDGHLVQIRHQPAFQLAEGAYDIHAFFVKEPRNAVAAGAVQAAVAGEQPEGSPALIDIGRGGLLKAGDIMAPVPETTVAHTKSGPECFRH